jgi:hypothetical protein
LFCLVFHLPTRAHLRWPACRRQIFHIPTRYSIWSDKTII